MLPEVEILDVYAEGVLCGSLDEDLDMDPEEGNSSDSVGTIASAEVVWEA